MKVFGRWLYQALEIVGHINMAFGVTLIICGACVFGPPIPDASQRVLVVGLGLGGIVAGALLFALGVYLESRWSGPRLWLRLWLSYTLNMVALYRTVRACRKAGYRWIDGSEAARMIAYFARGQEPETRAGEFVWSVYRGFTRS